MTTSTPNSHILVGVDGSTSALHALTWAGAEAQRRNLPLTLVHVIDHSSLGQGYNLGASASFFSIWRPTGRSFSVRPKTTSTRCIRTSRFPRSKPPVDRYPSLSSYPEMP